MSDNEPAYEHQKWTHELLREDVARAQDQLNQFNLATNEATIKSSELALRTAVLINGGAAISVLAFIGGLVGQGRIGIGQLDGIAASLTRFALGVASATAGMGLSYATHYLTQATQASHKMTSEPPFIEPAPMTKWWKLARHSVHIFAIAAGIASLILFIVGMFDVKNAITSFK
jgi:hypothetical protein